MVASPSLEEPALQRSLHLHFDCFSGLAGDMFLGACVDAGLPWEVLEDAVVRLGMEGVEIRHRRARRGGLEGERFSVLQDGSPVEPPDPDEPSTDEDGAEAVEAQRHADHARRTPEEIRGVLENSRLEDRVRDRALSLFARLTHVEATVHGVGIEEVHFHEVGAVDAIVDLVGAATAYEHFRPLEISCGPINVGGGRVATDHGILPVPAPATAELLRGLPIYGEGSSELVTPTGAVILAELVDEFGELPPLELREIGYGLGRRETPGRPNVFRLLVGERQAQPEGTVMVVETEIDDLSGEGFGFLMESLSSGPALDVFFTAVQMKKSRPGTLVSVLCREGDLEDVAKTLLTQSGSLGCRYYPVRRFEAQRRTLTASTPYGDVRVKEGRFGGERIALAPEFDDCRRLAQENNIAWRDVHQAAISALRHE